VCLDDRGFRMRIDCIFPTYPSNGSDKSTTPLKTKLKPGPKLKPKIQTDEVAPTAAADSPAPVATNATPDVAEQSARAPLPGPASLPTELTGTHFLADCD